MDLYLFYLSSKTLFHHILRLFYIYSITKSNGFFQGQMRTTESHNRRIIMSFHRSNLLFHIPVGSSFFMSSTKYESFCNGLFTSLFCFIIHCVNLIAKSYFFHERVLQKKPLNTHTTLNSVIIILCNWESFVLSHTIICVTSNIPTGCVYSKEGQGILKVHELSYFRWWLYFTDVKPFFYFKVSIEIYFWLILVFVV